MKYLYYNGEIRTETSEEIALNLIGKGWVEIQSQPDYNSATQHPPQWSGTEWIVRDLTAQEIFDRLPPYYETSAGIKLATSEQDQTAFTRMLALIDLTQMDPSEMVIIKDAAGEQHGVTVEQFKDLMKEYGAHCYSLHINP